MDLKRLTNEELQDSFRQLQAASPASAATVDKLQDAVHELQVTQFELEMQNRALRATQEELEQTIVRYADLYDYSPIGYVTLSAQGRIEEANLTAAELLQCERKHLVGSFLRKYLVARDVERFAVHVQECFQHSAPLTIDVQLQARNRGEPIYVQLSTRVARLPHSEEPQIRTALTDISPLKRSQQTLMEINREQETFAHSISHDLRAPLVTISNFSSLLLKGEGNRLDETARDFAQRIHNAAVRMDQLLLDLLEYSRLSRAEIKVESVPLESVLDDVLAQHQGRILETMAQITVERPLPRVMASREALGQILANLLTNALKYTVPGNSPIVQIYARDVDPATVGLTVADQGIGIAPEHHERIFKIFERLHNSSRFPGTGIGLALVRRAIERMGGRITVRSALNEGSRFELYLPKG
jgi:PAS domain S-box-containing protein